VTGSYQSPTLLLERCFFQRDPVTCARELVGCRLTCGALSGIVVETEAYDAEGDDACHTAFRPSARAFVSGYEAGAAYVYFSYGVHWMLNVLVKSERAGFVLIRALEPLEGIQEMKKARRVQDLRQLCSGPGKLTKALGISHRHHGRDMCSDTSFAFSPRSDDRLVNTSLRIGITRAMDLPWRFYAADNPHVSRTTRGKAGRALNPPGNKMTT
jgi:DNA-3-methyladenine glycosylase